MKRTDIDYTVEKTVETMKILEVLSFEPVSIDRIIERVGYIPQLNRKLKPDAVRRILITLKMLGYAEGVEIGNKVLWRRGHKKV